MVGSQALEAQQTLSAQCVFEEQRYAQFSGTPADGKRIVDGFAVSNLFGYFSPERWALVFWQGMLSTVWPADNEGPPSQQP